MTDKIVVLTTCGSADEAEKVARGLVEGHLAACVNIVPRIRSIYRWDGVVEEADEWLLLVKSRGDLLSDIQHAISLMHSYELPECIALPIVEGSEAYLAWIDAGTQLRKKKVDLPPPGVL